MLPKRVKNATFPRLLWRLILLPLSLANVPARLLLLVSSLVFFFSFFVVISYFISVLEDASTKKAKGPRALTQKERQLASEFPEAGPPGLSAVDSPTTVPESVSVSVRSTRFSLNGLQCLTYLYCVLPFVDDFVLLQLPGFEARLRVSRVGIPLHGLLP